MPTLEIIRSKFLALKPVMDERLTRLWAGAEAEALGEGGITLVERATGMSRTTIRAGRDELREGVTASDVVKVRRAGGGRPSIEDTTPGIVEALEHLVEPVTRGDPESPLRWTSKSTRKLSAELGEHGYLISPQKVGQLLRASRYSLHGAEKTLEGASRANRNKQFEIVNDRVERFHARGAPVIAVDTRKKQLAGDRETCGCGHELEHDVAWVDSGVDADTSAFAVRAIAEWWRYMGKSAYPFANELLIAGDAGGSNRARAGLWTTELQGFADHTGMAISVSHLPPGTSKWNTIEHRMLCRVTESWRGHPLIDRETVVQLIGSARTPTSLAVKAKLDTREDPTELGGWNYTLHPRHER